MACEKARRVIEQQAIACGHMADRLRSALTAPNGRLIAVILSVGLAWSELDQITAVLDRVAEQHGLVLALSPPSPSHLHRPLTANGYVMMKNHSRLLQVQQFQVGEGGPAVRVGIWHERCTARRAAL
jgi:hypothetical protein